MTGACWGSQATEARPGLTSPDAKIKFSMEAPVYVQNAEWFKKCSNGGIYNTVAKKYVKEATKYVLLRDVTV